jgi:hypothetical protein
MMISFNVTSLHAKLVHGHVSRRHAHSSPLPKNRNESCGTQLQVGFDQNLLGAVVKNSKTSYAALGAALK